LFSYEYILVLSILSIPLPTPRTQIDEHLETGETINEKQKRLTSLLSLQQIPTRTSLIRDMIKQGVLNFVYPELKNMYEWLEVEFNPLKLSTKMEESIQFVEKLSQPEYSQYMPALRDVTVVRLLQQISQVYQTIELQRFIELAPPIDRHRLEKIIVNAAKNKDVQVRIEHKSKSLTFGTDINLSNVQSIGNETSLKTNIIQKMPNEQIRNQLISISRALYTSMELINEKSNKERNEKLRREIAQTYFRDELIQRKEILKRRELIERYKEEKEKESREKVRKTKDFQSIVETYRSGSNFFFFLRSESNFFFFLRSGSNFFFLLRSGSNFFFFLRSGSNFFFFLRFGSISRFNFRPGLH
jgi:translation initiation factor 3 subunit A